MKLLQCYWLYSLCCALYSHDWLIYNWKLYLSLPFTFTFALPFSSILHLLPSGNYQFIFCIYESVPVLFCLIIFLGYACKWNNIFVFLWLVSLCIIPLGLSTLSRMARFRSFLLLSNIPLCVCVHACVCIHTEFCPLF